MFKDGRFPCHEQSFLFLKKVIVTIWFEGLRVSLFYQYMSRTRHLLWPRKDEGYLDPAERLQLTTRLIEVM